MQTLREVLERNVRLSPHRAAIIFDDKETSFATLHRRSQKLASALWQAGIRNGDRVSMLSMNNIEYVEVWTVGELAGFHINPVNFRLAAGEVNWIINDVAPKAFIFEEQYTALVASIKDKIPQGILFICIGTTIPDWAQSYESFLNSGAERDTPYRPRPEDSMSLMYTSGTTGRPKGVIRSHRADYNVAMTCSIELGIGPGDRYLLMMPMFHIGARAQQAAANWHGGTAILHRSFDPGRVLADIEKYRVTCTHMAPTLIHDCFQHADIDKRDLSSLKTVYYAAAPMPLGLLKRGLAKLGPVFVNGYGSTESLALGLNKIDHILEGPEHLTNRLKSVGQPLVTTDVCITDDKWNRLPPGEIGEITVRSGDMMDGYWNNDAATREVFRDGWFRTGDVGYADEENFIFLVDRKKDMIISGGENIYSREVENAISEHAAVSEVAIIGVPDARWGQSVRALIVKKSGVEISAEEIIAFTRDQIAHYKAPKSVIFIDELVRLPNGKINKIKLRELYGQS